jgi:P-type E1-E2 ATPase
LLGLTPEQCHGGLGPEDKMKAVEAASRNGSVFMVGDGVNDAAALSAATVGIAVHGGAEASLAAADVYLGRPGVAALVEVFTGAQRTLSVIRRCLVVSLGYNAVAAVLAIAGIVNALQAAILMPLASFTVLGMALWMRTFGGRAARPCP